MGTPLGRKRPYPHAANRAVQATGNVARGLSLDEAKHRLERDGYNELPEEKTNPLLKFLSYFWGPIPWMIEIAIVLSALVRHWADFGIILVLLVMNAVVGFWEEYQAGKRSPRLRQARAASPRQAGRQVGECRPASWCPAT